MDIIFVSPLLLVFDSPLLWVWVYYDHQESRIQKMARNNSST